jgi:hypothetical protein
MDEDAYLSSEGEDAFMGFLNLIGRVDKLKKKVIGLTLKKGKGQLKQTDSLKIGQHASTLSDK